MSIILVELLNIKGYVFPCSDIVSNSHVPDTLVLSEGKLNMIPKIIVPNSERIYFINLDSTKFSKGNKIKIIKSYKCNIKFTEGEPG